jgi:hypothetical protein
MTERIDLKSINHFVLSKQHLAGDSANTQLSQVVLDVGGLHASEAITPYLSLAARLPDFQPKELDQQLYHEPDMARIRCVRKSIYVHNEKLLPVMFAATSNKVIKASEHFMIYRGVPLSEYKALSDSILKLLEQQRLTTAEIKESLATDFDVSAVLNYMCDQGLLVRSEPGSGWRDRNYRYAIFKEQFPDVELGALEEREGILMLVRHYLEAFGPASRNDIVWWTGLGKIRIRSALRTLGDEVREIRTAEDNIPLLMLESELERLRASIPSQSSTVAILPNLDSYLMGYWDRHRYVDNHLYEYIVDNSGNATNVVLVNGRAAGVWDCSMDDEADFGLYLFDYQLAATGDLVRSRARRLGKLLTGQDVRIRQHDKMLPLSKQPAGAFMSPLKDMST